MIEEHLEFECPYCGTINFSGLDPTAGSSQDFVVDCEICCQPILISIRIDAEGQASIAAARENL